MKITSDNPARPQAATVKQLNDFLGLLKRLDNLPARVITNREGQLLLATRFGNIQPENQLPLKQGQQVLITLNPANGKPTVSPVSTNTNQVLLPANRNQALAQLLPPDKPVLARVVMQSKASTQIQISGTQLAMPQIAGLKQGQLISARLAAFGDQIELQTLEKKPLLKALLTQLLARAPTSTNKPATVVELFRIISTSGTGNNNANTSASQPSATSASSAAIPSRQAASTTGQPTSLLQLLPSLSSPQSKLISQWMAGFTQQAPLQQDQANQSPWIQPLRLIQRISNGEMTVTQIERLLNTLLPPKTEAQGTQQNLLQTQDSRVNQEMLLLQGREAARLIEQIGNQTQPPDRQTQMTILHPSPALLQPMTDCVVLPQYQVV